MDSNYGYSALAFCDDRRRARPERSGGIMAFNLLMQSKRELKE
jgi:hypothetical protein